LEARDISNKKTCVKFGNMLRKVPTKRRQGWKQEIQNILILLGLNVLLIAKRFPPQATIVARCPAATAMLPQSIPLAATRSPRIPSDSRAALGGGAWSRSESRITKGGEQQDFFKSTPAESAG
jgi:hypothetical protein